MEIFQAIILGVVEGLTEFLPISSTGHLIVADDMLGYHDTSKLFTVVVQLGAIAAVLWFYRRDLWRLVLGLIKGDREVQRFWLIWILATLPAGLIGLLLNERIEAWALTSVVAAMLILGGIAIWLIETYHRAKPAKDQPQFGKMTFRQAVLVGLYQVLALLPGVSRSGATIMGGLLSGLDRVTATAFSFYLSIPVLLLAGGFKLATGDVAAIPGGAGALIAGIAASFVTALIVVGWLLRYVSRHDFKLFAYYRIALGLLLFGLLGIGVIG